jgi:hypothetical protein
MTSQPSPNDVARITRALGWKPVSIRAAATDRAVSATAARWVVRDDSGRSAFAKVGATPLTAGWIRTEHRNYTQLQGWYMPRLIGFDDDGERPVLAIEDLSDCDWPPPWSEAKVTAVLEALAAIRETIPPPGLTVFEDEHITAWARIASSPTAFLKLGLCSEGWLKDALLTLLGAASRAPLSGTKLGHIDIRSDNLCFRDGRAVIVDWNHASLVNPDLDIAAWLPSLQSEGGPTPETILPHAPELAAWVAGFFCARAGEPPILEAPHVRPLQRRQATTALPWAARSLGLPQPRAVALT